MLTLVSILGRGQVPAAHVAAMYCFESMSVSILGRGQVPAAPPRDQNSSFLLYVSILGRGQVPAAPLPVASFASYQLLFQSSAGDKSRPLPASRWLSVRRPKFQSSAGDKSRPLGVAGRTSVEAFVSILGRGQVPAARGSNTHHRSRCLFQSSAGDKSRPLVLLIGDISCMHMFQSSAGDKSRPLMPSSQPGSQFWGFQSSAGDKSRPLQFFRTCCYHCAFLPVSANRSGNPLLSRIRKYPD